MKVKINARQLQIVEKLKATAFCLKVSCDALVEVPKEWEDKVESIEDFAECVFEKLTKATSQTSVNTLIKEGDLVTSPQGLEKVVDEMMKALETLAKESRRALDLPSELLYIKLFKEGLCTDEKKEKTEK